MSCGARKLKTKFGIVPESRNKTGLTGRQSPMYHTVVEIRENHRDLKMGRSNLNENSFLPGPKPGTVSKPDGTVVPVPAGWELLPPGDAALTRRVKAAGDYWIMEEVRGRKVFSKGIWACAQTISSIRAVLERERATEKFAKTQVANALRREASQSRYVDDFFHAVLKFLSFHEKHHDVGERLARAVTEHATPVGSGTVARTKRISLSERAEAAVIAWMRHNTTAYDNMTVPKVKGKRREIRRMLASQSQKLLSKYRDGSVVPMSCPLQKALAKPGQ